MEISQGGGDEMVGITRLEGMYGQDLRGILEGLRNDDETRFLRVIETLDGENYYGGYYSPINLT